LQTGASPSAGKLLGGGRVDLADGLRQSACAGAAASRPVGNAVP